MHREALVTLNNDVPLTAMVPARSQSSTLSHVAPSVVPIERLDTAHVKA